jgi:hypothetical protein
MQTGLEPTRSPGNDSEADALRLQPGEVAPAEAVRGESPPEQRTLPAPPAPSPATPQPIWRHGWPVPSSIAADPDVARACIYLPEFDPERVEQARVISGRVPLAEAELRSARGRRFRSESPELPHFEKVFRIAAALAGMRRIEESRDYDELLILTAWHTVRPGEEGFLGSYPKSLLCPLSHAAPPIALESLTPAQRMTFDRRAPIYLRYLLCQRFGLRTCADLENADLRHLLRSVGFRLIRASAVPEVAFAGCTRGEDPPVRPWKLTLRQELSDERAAELLIQAARWQIQYGLRLVQFDAGRPHWNIGAFERTDWEDAFLSLGVRVPPAFTRPSGLLDWRAVLARCLAELGTGNLPPEVLGRVVAVPQRVCHDSHQAIWEVLDRVSRTVLEHVQAEEPQLFDGNGGLNLPAARAFRRWVRLFDEVSPNILTRFGVSAFTALRRVAPEWFGWGPTQLKPWELEQEHGKWKGPRGRAMLRSAYAYALYESGLGEILTTAQTEPARHGHARPPCGPRPRTFWQCTLPQFSQWCARRAESGVPAYDFFYALASAHGLTPLLAREVSHTAAVSLLAGLNVHQHLPHIEGCWDVAMRTALEHHGGRLEVNLEVPDLVPLPLRLRKAVLAPLPFAYLHRALRWVRDFDLRIARESRMRLEEIPGWWEDDRIVGTPLLARLNDPHEPARRVLDKLRHEPWLELPERKMRFHALSLLISPRAAVRSRAGEEGLSAAEMRTLLRLALETALEHTNTAQVARPAIRSGFERLLAREDTREMLESLLLHVGTACETRTWGQVRGFIVLDAINDLLALTVRSALLHRLSAD